MDPITGGLLIGGSLLGGIMGDRTNRRNLRAQQERQRQIDQLFAQNRPAAVDMGAFMNEWSRAQGTPEQINFSPLSGGPEFNVPGVDFMGAATPRMRASNVRGSFGFDPAQMSMPSVAGNFGMDAALGEFTGLGRTTGQNFNIGQDAIAQFMRADPLQLSENARLANAADTGFMSDVNPVLDSLSRMQDMERERAMAEIRGASGSVGQRFGSAIRQQEQRALEDILTTNNAQRAQFALGAAENAAGRRMSATQQLAQNELAAAQLGVQNRGLGLNAAQAFAGNALQFGGMEAQMANQMSQFNASNINSARQFSAQNALQAALANQQAGLASGQFNAGSTNAARQFGASNALQVALANQASRNTAAQFNAGQAGAMNQFNAATGLQAGQFNANLAMQQLQQSFQNQFSVQQANAQMGMQAQQQNFANQLAQRQFGLSALQGGMGLGLQQQGLLNQQLLGQAGMAVPLAQQSGVPNAMADIGQFLAFLPMMQSMMTNRNQPAGVQNTVSLMDFPTRMNPISLSRN